MIDTYNGLSPSIFKFCNDQCTDYLDELFRPIGENSVITRFSNEKL